MKKSTFALFALMMLSWANVAASFKNPDFARPKTVIADAMRAMKTANKTGDEKTLFEAMMQIAIARASIDNDTRQESYESFIKSKWKDKGLSALSDLYAAQLLEQINNTIRFKIFDRQLPLSPRPASIVEWSQPMFDHVVDSLLQAGLDKAIGADNVPLKDYTGIIDANKLSLDYFPRVSDMAACRILNTRSNDSTLLKRMISISEKGSYPWFYWSARYIANPYDNNCTRPLYNFYNSSPDEAGRAYILSLLCSRSNFNNLFDSPDKYLDFLKNAAAKYRGTWIENTIQTEIDRTLQPSATLKANSLTSANGATKINIKYRNASEIVVKVYNFPPTYDRNRLNTKYATPPVKTIHVSLGERSVVTKDTAVYIELPRGYNLIVPDMKPSVQRQNYKSSIKTHTVSRIPTVITTGGRSRCFITNASDGQPCKGVEVYEQQYTRSGIISGRRLLGITDSMGCVQFSGNIKAIVIGTGNDCDVFDDIYINSVREKSDNTPQLSLTTDLGAVHPGDTIKWAAVVSDTLGVVKDLDLNVYLYSSEYDVLDSLSIISDNMGRAAGYFKIPDDIRTGRFHISGSGNSRTINSMECSFTVSDFKMPQYRATDIRHYSLIPEQNAVRIEGRIVTYAGAGISDAVVSAHETTNDSTFKTVTDNTGRFAITIDSAFLSKNPVVVARDYDDTSIKYLPYMPEDIDIDDLRVDLSATMADGSTLDMGLVSTPYFPNRLELKGTDLYKDLDNKISPTIKFNVTNAADSLLKTKVIWKITDTDSISHKYLDGALLSTDSLSLNIKSLKPGEYKFHATCADSLSNTVVSEFTVYDTNSAILPDSTGKIFIPTPIKASSSDVTIPVLSSRQGMCILMGYDDSIESFTPHILDKGWNNISLPPYKGNNETASVHVLYNDSCRFSTFNIGLYFDKKEKEKAPKPLRIVTQSFRDKLMPGASESWSVKLVDKDNNGVKGAIIASIWNTRLNQFGVPDNLSLAPKNRLSAYTYCYSRRPYSYFNSVNISAQLSNLLISRVLPPHFRNWLKYSPEAFYDSDDVVYELNETVQAAPTFAAGIKIRGTANRIYGARAMKSAATASIEVVEDEAEEKESADVGASLALDEVVTAAYGSTKPSDPSEAFEYRKAEVFSALWRPDLMTDSTGCANIDFIIPNDNSIWDLRLFAWTTDGKSTTLSHSFTTSKPIMVKPNLPRFIRRGDKATVIATVMNTTDSVLTATTVCEVVNTDGIVLNSSTLKDKINAGGNSTARLTFDMPLTYTPDSVIFRVRSYTDTYSDGEQTYMPVLAAQSHVTEAINFYLNPSDSIYSLTLPQPTGSDFKLMFSYTANPMATIIESLPTLWKNTYPTAISLTSALYGSSIASGLARQHPEVSNYLHSKHIDASSVAKTSLEKLIELQQHDGGFKWGSWDNGSSLWVTLTILDNLADLQRLGYLDNSKSTRSMIAKALEYADANVRDTDLTYTIARSAFASHKPSLNGQKVIDATLRDITRNWRRMDIDTKALSAIALDYNGRKALARELVASLDQFATTTRDKGMQFKNISSLMTYGHLLEAYHAVKPTGKDVDALRQYLIYRRQATDWGNSLITSYVISSFLNSGTRWQASSSAPSLKVDSKTIKLEDPQGHEMVYSAPLSGNELTLTLHDSNTPSYGATIASYTAPMDEIKAYSDNDQISIEKRFMVQGDDLKWHYTDGKDFKVGQKVRVLLTVISPRPMSYVNITDQRAATFEPTQQLSRYYFNEGLCYYLENRDTATNFYINYLPAGTYQLSYDVSANNAGTFASGIATATCDRAPSLTAHSAGTTVTVVP